jgi:hypothetical protein
MRRLSRFILFDNSGPTFAAIGVKVLSWATWIGAQDWQLSALLFSISV